MVRCCCPGPFRAHTKWQDGAVPWRARALTFARAHAGLSSCPPVLLSSHIQKHPGALSLHQSPGLSMPVPCPQPCPCPCPVGWHITCEWQQKPSGWPGPVFHGFCSTPFTQKTRACPPAPLLGAGATCQALMEPACAPSPCHPVPPPPPLCSSRAPASSTQETLRGCRGAVVGCRWVLQPIAALPKPSRLGWSPPLPASTLEPRSLAQGRL